jgi:hypothetical protein
MIARRAFRPISHLPALDSSVEATEAARTAKPDGAAIGVAERASLASWSLCEAFTASARNDWHLSPQPRFLASLAASAFAVASSCSSSAMLFARSWAMVAPCSWPRICRPEVSR